MPSTSPTTEDGKNQDERSARGRSGDDACAEVPETRDERQSASASESKVGTTAELCAPGRGLYDRETKNNNGSITGTAAM